MRTLAFKLTLAFALIGVIGITVFGVLVARRTQTEFNRFLSARDQNTLVNALTEYFEQHASWQKVTVQLLNTPPLKFYSNNTTLVDAKHNVIYANIPITNDEDLAKHKDEYERVTLQTSDQVAGYLYVHGSESGTPFSNPLPPPKFPLGPERDFLGRVIGAAITSGAIAIAMALVLGYVLARTLTESVRQLTTATRAMASGQLDQKVTVRSNDEIGELAQSFNQMSADLSRASQSRKQMTADLAHDLRTPLSILRGYTEGLKEGRIDGSTKLFDIMHGEVEHLQRLVEDLRVLSLADASELTLAKRAVDPRALLERTALAYFMQAEDQGLKLIVDAADNLPSISVDTDRMTQVLNNLVSNALRYTKQGEITLGAGVDKSRRVVYLCVSDTGSGIAVEDIPYVFDRFYRADKSRQREVSSNAENNASGLGLAIAKAIVETHGGTIGVQSEISHGTTFTIAISL